MEKSKRKNKNPKVSSGVRTICFILSVTGMAIQNILVTTDYFKFTSTTEVMMEVENQYSPPAFSVCYMMTQIIRKGLFKRPHRCFNPSYNRNIRAYMSCKKSLYNHTAKELDQMTVNLSKTVLYLNVSRDGHEETQPYARCGYVMWAVFHLLLEYTKIYL